MEFESVVRIDVTKEVEVSAWGKALLEELLLKAAKKAADDGVDGHGVTINLNFHISADVETESLLISTPSDIETALLTRLPMRPS